jgi:hypothetical protein
MLIRNIPTPKLWKAASQWNKLKQFAFIPIDGNAYRWSCTTDLGSGISVGYESDLLAGLNWARWKNTYLPGPGMSRAWLWPGVGDLVDLHPNGPAASRALGVSNDGSMQVGGAYVKVSGFKFREHAGLWTGTAGSWVDLHPSIAFDSSVAYDAHVDAYGTIMQVGMVTLASNPTIRQAGYWAGTPTWTSLHPAGAKSSEAWSGDGYIVGYFRDFSNISHAYVFDPVPGGPNSIDLSLLLPPGSWGSTYATSSTLLGNCAFVCGYGFNKATLRNEPLLWTITPLPPPGEPCYVDCDESGTLTPNDCVCFQTQFAAGALYADCDGDGELTICDFVCFTKGFEIGC